MSGKAKFFVLLLISALTISFSVSTARAEAAEKSGSPFKNLVLKMFGWTAKTTEKSVNAVGTGVKKSADVVVNEVKDTGELVTKGKGEKVKDVLVKPVTGTAEAVGGTAYGVLNAPIEAGKEVSEKKEATK